MQSVSFADNTEKININKSAVAYLQHLVDFDLFSQFSISPVNVKVDENIDMTLSYIFLSQNPYRR